MPQPTYIPRRESSWQQMMPQIISSMMMAHMQQKYERDAATAAAERKQALLERQTQHAAQLKGWKPVPEGQKTPKGAINIGGMSYAPPQEPQLTDEQKKEFTTIKMPDGSYQVKARPKKQLDYEVLKADGVVFKFNKRTGKLVKEVEVKQPKSGADLLALEKVKILKGMPEDKREEFLTRPATVVNIEDKVAGAVATETGKLLDVPGKLVREATKLAQPAIEKDPTMMRLNAKRASSDKAVAREADMEYTFQADTKILEEMKRLASNKLPAGAFYNVRRDPATGKRTPGYFIALPDGTIKMVLSVETGFTP